MVDKREAESASEENSGFVSAPPRKELEDRRNRSEVARLTPTGRGAVACIGVRGADAWSHFLGRWGRSDGARAVFDAWTPTSASRPYFGLFRFDELGGASEEIVLRRRSENSFELNCHGGDVVSSRLVKYFVDRGASEISGGDWERAVELEELGLFDERFDERLTEPRFSLFYGAADELIAQATTEHIAKSAIRQRRLWREFFKQTADAKENLTCVLGIDAALNKLDDALANGSWGRWLCKPITVALLGAPNVGKSSLLNAVLGYERAVVSPTLGTTRDLVEASLVIDGWNFRLIDAAGLRETVDEIERIGTRLALESASDADVVVKIYDVTRSRAEQDKLFAQFLAVDAEEVGNKSVIVLNKIDLPRSEWSEEWREGDALDAVSVSAKTLDGLEELLAALVHAAFGTEPSGQGLAVWLPEQIDYLTGLRKQLLALKQDRIS